MTEKPIPNITQWKIIREYGWRNHLAST